MNVLLKSSTEHQSVVLSGLGNEEEGKYSTTTGKNVETMVNFFETRIAFETMMNFFETLINFLKQ